MLVVCLPALLRCFGSAVSWHKPCLHVLCAALVSAQRQFKSLLINQTCQISQPLMIVFAVVPREDRRLSGMHGHDMYVASRADTC